MEEGFTISCVCLYSLTDLVLTSSISGRHACPSEEVTFTCTAQVTVLFWGYEAFGERALHYLSPPFRGNFRAEIVSYDRNQPELLSFISELSCNCLTQWNHSYMHK